MASYGYCPICGAEGDLRERRPNGNDTCANNHVYPSREALAAPRAAEDRLVSWRGRPIDSMTREELIIALTQSALLYRNLLNNSIKDLATLRASSV